MPTPGINLKDHLSLKIQSDPADIAPARVQIEQFCRDSGFDKLACDEIGLCVNEALANVIRHAYNGDMGRPIVIECSRNRLGASISIRDWGRGINPEELPEKPRDPMRPGGLGLICLRQMMDGVVFTPQPDGMLLEMTRSKSRRSA